VTISEADVYEDAAYKRFREDYTSGTHFRRNGRPDPIARYNGGPVPTRAYGALLQTVGKFASEGGWQGQVANLVVHKVNPYATVHEALSQVSEAIGEFFTRGFTDVHRKASPEPGRPSSYTDLPVTEAQALTLCLFQTECQMAFSSVGCSPGFVPGLGWVVQRWMRETATSIPASFPHLRAKYGNFPSEALT
jgi:hypothetical protein